MSTKHIAVTISNNLLHCSLQYSYYCNLSMHRDKSHLPRIIYLPHISICMYVNIYVNTDINNCIYIYKYNYLRMRPAPRGFCPRLFIGARSRVYLPVDHRGALIGVARYLRVFVSVHTPPSSANETREGALSGLSEIAGGRGLPRSSALMRLF